jgi:hypothetical protein
VCNATCLAHNRFWESARTHCSQLGSKKFDPCKELSPDGIVFNGNGWEPVKLIQRNVPERHRRAWLRACHHPVERP